MAEIKTYTVLCLPGSDTSIYGRSLKDAVCKNLRFFIEERENNKRHGQNCVEDITLRKQYSLTGFHKDSILGGKGGYVVCIDDGLEMCDFWIHDTSVEEPFDVTFNTETGEITNL